MYLEASYPTTLQLFYRKSRSSKCIINIEMRGGLRGFELAPRGLLNSSQGRGRAERASPAVLRCFLSWRLDYGPWPGPERLPPHFPVLPTPWGLEWLPPWFQEWRCNKGVLTQPRCQTRTDSSTHLKDEVFSHPHHLSPPLPQTPASLYPPQPAVFELL